MNCDAIRPWLEAHADDELDLARTLEVEAHAQSCAACASRLAEFRARKAALRAGLPRHSAPAGLEAKLRARLPAARPAATVRGAAWTSQRFWAYGGMAAALALALGGGFTWGSARAGRGLLANEAIADHVRSLEPGHLLDVVSTDQHTVKPWFAGKIDFSPPVTDLAAAGFPLLGGRLDQIGGRTAAAIVFGRRKHTIDLFVWPAEGGAIADSHSERAGFQLESWAEDGLNYLAVSEVSADDLRQFTAAYRGSRR